MLKRRSIFIFIFFATSISIGSASASVPLSFPSPTPLPYAGDRPEDAPDFPAQTALDPDVQTLFQQQPGLMMAASAPAGATVAEYDLPKVRLQVSDGYNLDQYLHRQDGEIAFDLDLQNMVVAPGQSATLVLRVFDVGQNGAISGGPKVAAALGVLPEKMV